MSTTVAATQQRTVLEAFDRAVGRELHNLRSRPDLLWQQLHNRLQWEDEPVSAVIADAWQQRTVPGTIPWLRTRTPFSDQGVIRTLEAGGARFGRCAVAPDSSYVVSAGDDGTLRIWSAVTGEELRAIRAHGGPIEDCAVAPDGSYVVSAGADRTLKLWDPASGEEVCTLAGHTGSVTACAVAPDGSYIVSAGDDSTLRMWDPASGDELRSVPSRSRINACAVAPDGTYLACATVGGTLDLYDPAGRSAVRTLDVARERTPSIDRVKRGIREFGRDFKLAIALHQPPSLLPSFRRRRDSRLDIHGCAIAPDGSYVISAGSDGTLILWDPGTGHALRALEGSAGLAYYIAAHARQERRAVTGHTDAVLACAVAPDGSYVVSASDDGTLKVWDPATGEELRTLAGHAYPATACAVAPDGSYVVSAGNDNTVKLWDLGGGDGRRPRARHTALVTACAVAPDGSYVVSASDDGTLKVWDPATGDELRTLMGALESWHEASSVNACAVAPDGSYVISATDDGKLKAWDPVTGEELRTIRGAAKDSGHGCAVAPDGSFVVAPHGFRLELLNPITGARLQTLSPSRGTYLGEACAVSPDGSYVACAGSEGTLELWDPADSVSRTLAGHTGQVNACAFSPDGSYCLTASDDATLKLWDPASGEEICTLVGHAGRVVGCGVLADGSLVVSASSDGTVKLWAPAARVPDVRPGVRDPGSRWHEQGTLILPAPLWCMAIGATGVPIACGDRGGRVYLAEIRGIELGPPIVTAVDFGEGLVVRCPHCNASHTFHAPCRHCEEPHHLDDWRGREIECPTASCMGALKVNEFVVERRWPATG